MDASGVGDASESADFSATGAPSGAPADDIDLRESLGLLAQLGMGPGQQGLEDMLRHVAQFAVHAIPRADGAGLTLLAHDKVDTIVATSEFVREVDAIQYSLGEGPCITAATEQHPVMSGGLSADPAWPRFGPRVGRLGVHSALSLPLLVETTVVGAMNVYAHARNAFDSRALELGRLFMVPAAISVQNAQALSQARRLAEQMQAALASRSVIDQALGILMSRGGYSADEAFDRLRTASQAQNRKLALIAEQIVQEAVRRARARRPDVS